MISLSRARTKASRSAVSKANLSCHRAPSRESPPIVPPRPANHRRLPRGRRTKWLVDRRRNDDVEFTVDVIPIRKEPGPLDDVLQFQLSCELLDLLRVRAVAIADDLEAKRDRGLAHPEHPERPDERQMSFAWKTCPTIPRRTGWFCRRRGGAAGSTIPLCTTATFLGSKPAWRTPAATKSDTHTTRCSRALITFRTAKALSARRHCDRTGHFAFWANERAQQQKLGVRIDCRIGTELLSRAVAI